MTFIITPYGKAFRMYEDAEFDCKAIDIVTDYVPWGKHVGYQITVKSSNLKLNGNVTYPISPIFTILDDDLTNNYICCADTIDEVDNFDSCKFYAIEWLEHFLIRLSKQPHVIHCTSDGEMFIN